MLNVRGAGELSTSNSDSPHSDGSSRMRSLGGSLVFAEDFDECERDVDLVSSLEVPELAKGCGIGLDGGEHSRTSGVDETGGEKEITYSPC